jgi:Protein of unknwon function (DUF3310)
MKPSKDQVGGQHYKSMPIQPAEFIHKNGIGFLEGNVIKYVCRHATKSGKEDLLKARHYIDLLLEWQYPTQLLNDPPTPLPALTEEPWTCTVQQGDELFNGIACCSHGRLICAVCKFP